MMVTTYLSIVHTRGLFIGGCSELQARDVIKRLRNGCGHNEGVCYTGCDVTDLDVQLLPVAVEPSAVRRGVHAVQSDDCLIREEGVEKETNYTAYGVLGEQI